MKAAKDYIKEYSIIRETTSKYYEIRPGGQKMRVLSDLISGENIGTILTEHNQEIKDLIDDLLLMDGWAIPNSQFCQGWIKALTTLESKL